jgi:hypothetical protein
MCGIVPAVSCRPQCVRVVAQNSTELTSTIYAGARFIAAAGGANTAAELHSFPQLTPDNCLNLCRARDCVGWTFDATQAAATRRSPRAEVRDPECLLYSHLQSNQLGEPLMQPVLRNASIDTSGGSQPLQPADLVVSGLQKNLYVHLSRNREDPAK